MLNGPILVRGFALRDEFSCPITRELMRDPVIAADGHTYDREAIEMWLRNHDTSPKTGQHMEQLSLVPNLNLRRLIKDLLNEGGEGLYVHEMDGDVSGDGTREGGDGVGCNEEGHEYRFALVTEHILVLKCLGPTDSDWNNKSFRVTQRGCIGGRKQPALLAGKDFMQFSDATVSRRHFGIVFDKEDKRFSLCDFGSAGGTFVRLASGVPTPLYPGMMIMLGKHQLEVTQNPPDEMEVDSSAADSTPTSSAPVVAPSGDKSTNSAARYRPPRPVDPHLHHHPFSGTSGTGGSVGVREGAATDQEESGCQRERGRPSSALLAPKPSKAEDGGLSSLRFGVAVGGGEAVFGSGTGEQAPTGGALGPVLEGAERRSRQDSSRSPLPHQNASGGEDDASVLDTPLQEKQPERGAVGGSDDEKGLEGLEKSFEASIKLAKGHRRVCLVCFAPEGTPIQGKRFFVGRTGATLGRRQTNSIAFSHESNGTVMGIDASISGEHARITYDEEGDYLCIMDGTHSKPSTNGTWLRLSGMHRESRPYPLSHGSEILIGTVRFSVTLETMVVEKELNASNRDYFMSLASGKERNGRSSPPWAGGSRQEGRGGGRTSGGVGR